VRKIFSVICFLAFSVSSCTSFTNEEPADLGPLPEVSCVAVLPTAIPILPDDGLSAARKESLTNGAIFFDSVLLDDLDDRPEFKVLTENQLDAILSDPWGGSVQQVGDIGRATGCGAVLKTGAFSMNLVGVERGIVLWSSSFDESQKALFDDIFSFDKAKKRGFKWLSVQELSRDGLKRRLEQLPYFQEVESE